MTSFDNKWAWLNSDARRALQRQQADAAAGFSSALFFVLGVPAVGFVFWGEHLSGVWQTVVYSVAAALGIILGVAHIPLTRWHIREVKRIDEDGAKIVAQAKQQPWEHVDDGGPYG